METVAKSVDNASDVHKLAEGQQDMQIQKNSGPQKFDEGRLTNRPAAEEQELEVKLMKEAADFKPEEQELEVKLMKEAADFKKRKEERILSLAAGEAIRWGVGGATTVGAATVLATMQSAKFNRFTQISAKVSLPVMAGLFLFALKYELAITNMNRNPHLWEDLSEKNLRNGRITYMPVHHRVANFLYDHPFGCVAGLGAPFAAYILKTQLALKHITFSQRIMHSRVFAQGGILTMGMGIMAFREYMNKRGRFPELSKE